MIPISELITVGNPHVCDRALFSFVNRSLNEHGLRALVIENKGDLLLFKIEKMEPPT